MTTYDMKAVATEQMDALDRLMDRRPLTGFDRGLVAAALGAAATQGFIAGKTFEHDRNVAAVLIQGGDE